jgi:hypothetical protein
LEKEHKLKLEKYAYDKKLGEKKIQLELEKLRRELRELKEQKKQIKDETPP